MHINGEESWMELEGYKMAHFHISTAAD